jgi:hypothetical protein
MFLIVVMGLEKVLKRKIRGTFHGLKKLNLKNFVSLITLANKKYSNA